MIKSPYNKVVLATGLFSVVTLILLFGSFVTHSQNHSFTFGWPRFAEHDQIKKEQLNDDFLVEKFVQTNENGTDMRAALFLTQHRFFLEQVAKIEVEFHERKYTLNDLCFKPHTAIFELQNPNGPSPQYLRRLHLEMRRLSPCLISTPLNCFYDSYLVYSQIGKWNVSVDFLNRRLRNSYLEVTKSFESTPYVKANSGPKVIEEWAQHMSNLSSQMGEDSSWFGNVQRWLSSIEPRRKVCADPMRSCDEILDAENYFNICTVMQNINNIGERRRQILKFEFESGDEEFTTNLDCVNDREKFIEWMKERELRGIMKTLAPQFNMPNHRDIVNQRCEGIFHDVDADSADFFNGARNFANDTTSFDSIRSEFALMTPKSLLEVMRDADEVNGFESIWTEQRAAEILELFRSALREEANKFNGHRASKKIRVMTRMEDPVPTKSEVPPWEISLYFVLFCYLTVVFVFFSFVWEKQRLRSLGMFFLRDVSSTVTFLLICSNDGTFVWNLEKIHYIVLSTVVNLFLTTRMTFCRQRVRRCIQRANQAGTSSNFSSLASKLIGLTPDESDGMGELVIAVYELTKYQAGLDVFSKEKFERITSSWCALSTCIVPIFGIYWYFVDPSCLDICVLILPSLLIAAIEEYLTKSAYVKERNLCRAAVKALTKPGEHLTQDEMGAVMSGRMRMIEEEKRREAGLLPLEEPEIQNEEESDGILKQKRLEILSASVYDLNDIVAFPNKCSRTLRMNVLSVYFRLLKVGQRALVFPILAFFVIFTAISLLFVPISRTPAHFGSINHDSLFIDVQARDFSIDWGPKNEILNRFTNEIESIKSLKLVSNWQNSFKRFNKRMEKIKQIEKWEIRTSPAFSEWRKNEPINWAITASLASPDHKSRAPSPFVFRLRYDISDTHNETTMIETVERLDELFEKYSTSFSSISGVGQIYEHYHRTAVAWNNYAFKQLLASAIFIVLIFLTTFLFATQPRVSTTLLFSILVVGTRIVISAVVWLLSIENYHLFTNFSLLVGFLAAWHPLCDLCRFRSRVFFKRTHPELTRSRIRIPFVAAVDVAQFFGTLIPVSVLSAIVSAVFEPARFFFLPTVLLIVIQLLALFFAIAVVAVTRQMFEPSVRTSLRSDLEGGSTKAQIYALTNKKTRDVAQEMEMQLIQPNDRMTFWAPKKDPTAREDTPEEDPEVDEPSPRPGPSSSRSQQSRPIAAFTSCGLESLRAPDLPSPQNPDKTEITPYVPLSDEYYMRCDIGLPLDSSVKTPFGMTNEQVQAHLAQAEENYELDEEEEDEEEDVKSRGEPDEETEAVVAKLRARWGQQAEESRSQSADVMLPSVPATPPPNNERPIASDRMQFRERNEMNSDDEADNEVANCMREDQMDEDSGSRPLPGSVNLSDVLSGRRPAPHPESGYFVVLDCQMPPGYVPPPNFYIPGNVLPRMVHRAQPRNPYTEPPNWIEVIQENDNPTLGPHPRAAQYPAHFSRAQVAFCEDIFWTERIVPLPENVRVPPRPLDYLDIPLRTPPPENVDWEPPAGPPVIQMPPEYYALHEARRREYHRQRDAAERATQKNQNKTNPGK